MQLGIARHMCWSCAAVQDKRHGRKRPTPAVVVANPVDFVELTIDVLEFTIEWRQVESPAEQNLTGVSIFDSRLRVLGLNREKNPRSELRGQHCGGVIRNKRNDCIHHRRDAETFAMSQQERNDESKT